METFWDWLTVLFFGSLVVLMLQRSMEENPDDKLILYLPPAIGCAASNYVGNNYSDVGAALILIGAVIFVYKILKFPVFYPTPDDTNKDS
jgi:hypothetical protein